MDKKDIKLLVGLQCFELGLGTEIRNTRQICLQLAYRSSVLGKSEFTKITGSDFDIDHLYLVCYNVNSVLHL